MAGLAALAPTDNLDHERLARSGKSLLSIASVAQDKIAPSLVSADADCTDP